MNHSLDDDDDEMQNIFHCQFSIGENFLLYAIAKYYLWFLDCFLDIGSNLRTAYWVEYLGILSEHLLLFLTFHLIQFDTLNN